MSACAKCRNGVVWVLPLALLGCSNEPSALTLKVEPTKPAFRNGELIQLKVTLETNDRAVCLSKSRYFRVLIASEDKAAEEADEGRTMHCGTGILETLILFPWLYAFAWLDVADVAGRFEVIGPGNHNYQLIAVSPQRKWQTGKLEEYRQHVDRGGEPIGPGRVAITVVLHNERGFCGDFLPLPIGWALFKHPAEGKTSVILDGP